MMKRIDPNTLFSLFEANDEQVYEENGVADTLKNPFVLMGMVVRGVDNYRVLDKLYLTNHKKHYTPVRELTKFKYFCRLFEYLERIDYNKFETRYTISESYNSPHTNVNLNLLLHFFESIEHYEKCAVIKKYIDLLYESVGNIKTTSL
tara:strand:- start:170 stop:613 length:444 start_codon:yes stop_codon:yes gene_type:complete